MSNNDERLFGLDPTSGSSVNPVEIPLDSAAGTFAFTRRDTDLTEASFSIWTSTDLVSWEKDTGAVLTPGTMANEVESVEVQITLDLLTSLHLFVQVRGEE